MKKNKLIQLQNKNWDRFFLVLRWLVAIIFIYAGVGKIINPTSFAEDIDNYRILPYLLVSLMAIILPWLEVLCGLFLIIGKFQKGAALTLLGLTFMFLIAMVSAVVRGLDISCGCFATADEFDKIGYTRLAEEVIFWGLVVLIYLHSIKIIKPTYFHNK